jgi:hypothetical protein
MSIETVQTGYPGQPWTLIAFITRKPGTSREEFSLHWQKTHAVLVAPWAEKWGIIKYRQVSKTRPCGLTICCFVTVGYISVEVFFSRRQSL